VARALGQSNLDWIAGAASALPPGLDCRFVKSYPPSPARFLTTRNQKKNAYN
jgi:hypothetical protein